MVLTLEQLTIEHEQLSFTERKRQELLERNPQKAEYILRIEKMWEEFAQELFNREVRGRLLERLLEAFRLTIQKKAKALEKEWINKKIPAAEFEHEFWITAWMLCEENYNHYTEFYLYETLLLTLERRGIDIVRKYTNAKKRVVSTDSLPLLSEADNLYPSDEDIEKQTIDRILVQQLLSDKTLTVLERGILKTMYEHPDLSHRKIGEMLGLHHEQVKRNLERIKQKLQHYEYIFD